MAGYTAEEVLDLVTGENNHLDPEDDIDIEEDPSFPLPHESSSGDEESGNETEGKQHQMKALKCRPSAQFAYNYTINVSSKCGNIISHRSSVFEGRHNAIDL